MHYPSQYSHVSAAGSRSGARQMRFGSTCSPSRVHGPATTGALHLVKTRSQLPASDVRWRDEQAAFRAAIAIPCDRAGSRRTGPDVLGEASGQPGMSRGDIRGKVRRGRLGRRPSRPGFGCGHRKRDRHLGAPPGRAGYVQVSVLRLHELGDNREADASVADSYPWPSRSGPVSRTTLPPLRRQRSESGSSPARRRAG